MNSWIFMALGAASGEWSLGAMTSWRTTPLRGRWAESETVVLDLYGGEVGPTRYSESALHLVGSWRHLALDLSLGSEFGTRVSPSSFVRYQGVRYGVRAGLILLSTRAPADRIDPVNLSVGAGTTGWLVCCSATGGSMGRYSPGREGLPLLLHVGNRLWLWEPLGIDVRYEVPLGALEYHNTVSVGVVFAARR
jgi:hypothetical protein